MRRPKSRNYRLQKRESEAEEIQLLNSWIESGKPDSGSNPLSLPPLPAKDPVGRLDDDTYSRYAGCTKFKQLPLSKRTKDGLRDSKKYSDMTEIQRAALPHALCGRDILGAAKTGSGKTLAFIIPVLEILYKARWGPEDGVGGIIISPTRELADQIFGVLNIVGKHHEFSAGRLIGGQKDIDMEKEHANDLNILICTPGRLLQHMDETPNFDCSQLQVLVLDEADRILDVGFKKELNAIVSQLPKHRQTLLFSATQTKSVKDLARLSLKDPEYISVHEEATTATPTQLHQTAMVVPLDQKLDMLWSFIKSHLNSKILVFLTTCKQAKFAYETFKKLRPGIPLKCLHGRMKQERRLGIYSQFCEAKSVVLFATDVASRGLDFNKNVDWVVQVDCPDDVAGYIHRVGRTARYLSSGRSVLFIMPSEMKFLEKLQDKKIPIKFIKANTKRLLPVSGLLAALLVKYTELQALAERAFITYLKSINFQKDKEVFDVTKLPIDEFAASLGLPMTPKISFKPKNKGKPAPDNCLPEFPTKKDLIELPKESRSPSIFEEAEELLIPKDKILGGGAEELLIPKDKILGGGAEEPAAPGDDLNVTRVLKKKKLKINIHRPLGTRVVFDEEGKALPPLATLADTSATDTTLLDKDKVNKRFAEMREEMKIQDKEDMITDRKRRKDKRLKQKEKWKKQNEEEDDDESEEGSDRDTKRVKHSKKYFDSDDDDDNNDGGEEKKKDKNKMGLDTDSISLAEQEELALKLLSSMQ